MYGQHTLFFYTDVILVVYHADIFSVPKNVSYLIYITYSNNNWLFQTTYSHACTEYKEQITPVPLTIQLEEQNWTFWSIKVDTYDNILTEKVVESALY